MAKLKERWSEGDIATLSYDEGVGTFKVQSLGLSAIYDFQAMSGFTPYVGLRAGINQLKSEANGRYATLHSATGPVVLEAFSESEKKTKVGVGALAGVQYAINQNLALDAGVEYNHLGKIDDTKVNQYGAKVGVRYNF